MSDTIKLADLPEFALEERRKVNNESIAQIDDSQPIQPSMYDGRIDIPNAQAEFATKADIERLEGKIDFMLAAFEALGETFEGAVGEFLNGPMGKMFGGLMGRGKDKG